MASIGIFGACGWIPVLAIRRWRCNDNDLWAMLNQITTKSRRPERVAAQTFKWQGPVTMGTRGREMGTCSHNGAGRTYLPARIAHQSEASAGVPNTTTHQSLVCAPAVNTHKSLASACPIGPVKTGNQSSEGPTTPKHREPRRGCARESPSLDVTRPICVQKPRRIPGVAPSAADRSGRYRTNPCGTTLHVAHHTLLFT